MNRSLTLIAAVVALLALPAAASAYISIDHGIAGARIGNTGKQVRAALGKPKQRTTGMNDFGYFVEYRYVGGLRVLFQGGRKVSSVSTTGLGDRTTKGVGVGSSEATAKARHPKLTCETIAGVRSCHTGTFMPGKRVTDFLISKKGRVTRVTVGIVID
jgi:hypothetical protein